MAWSTFSTTWQPLEQLFTGAYGNFESQPTTTSRRLAFPSAVQHRLQALKTTYDPTGRLAALPQ
jgi:hypothetical protein